MSDPSVTIVERRPEALVICVQTERLDEASLKSLRSEVSSAASESPELPTILDMEKVSIMPSLSLGAMVQLSKEFQARKQRLMLAGLQQFVRETMAITRLDRVFEIHEDLSAALKAARGGI
jgi:anti-sigma B factor antagonist